MTAFRAPSSMRITFLTGSSEPGKDGVGDYTRQLSAECVRLGASCQVIALADRHVTQPVAERLSTSVDLLRLPHRLRWSRRLEAADAAIRDRTPDWVSLQFVPYSYQRWGLAYRLAEALPQLTGSARLHVMLHEIWIGGDGSWRRQLISAGQRQAMRRICGLPGAVIQTSNRTYQQMLDAEGIHADVLPLFGSVPAGAASAMPWLKPRLEAAGCDNVADHRADWWLFVLFGTLHPAWPAEPLMTRIRAVAAAARKRVAVISVGRQGGGEAVWRRLMEDYGADVPMVCLGEQPDERIGELLNTVDFGIATNPYVLLGKSATAAAMIEHGLPVIVNREDGPRVTGSVMDPRDADQLIRIDAGFDDRLSHATRRAPGRRLPAIAAQFLAGLSPSIGVPTAGARALSA